MPLKSSARTCVIEVYGPDEDPARIICVNANNCPLGHPGELGLDCFGAGNAVPDAGVQMPGPTLHDGPPLPQSRTATGTPEVEPGAGKAVEVSRLNGIVGQSKSVDGPSAPDSHVVVADDEKWWIRDLHEEQAKKGGFISREKFEELLAAPGLEISEEQLEQAVDVLTQAAYKRWQDYERSGTGHHGTPPPIPILGPEASKKFLEDLDNFKLTPEQEEFYLDAINRFPPEKSRKLLKHRRRYAPRRTGGMIRVEGNKQGQDEEEESPFGVDMPSVKPETELEKTPPQPERPDESEEEEDEQVPAELEDVVDDEWEQIIDEFETSGLGYVCGLEAWTDDDGDHTLTLTLDNLSIDIMLSDFLEILSAFNKVKGRLVGILNT
jgi:hypothetical protein